MGTANLEVKPDFLIVCVGRVVHVLHLLCCDVRQFYNPLVAAVAIELANGRRNPSSELCSGGAWELAGLCGREAINRCTL